MPLQEPIRWQNLITTLNEYMKYHDFLITLIPITADIFVFLYPFLLIILYIIWLIKNSDYYKECSLRIFWSAIFSSAFNVFLQIFFSKSRPLAVRSWIEEETFLHQFLPSSSFPSDHAAMSMGLAVWILIRWIEKKDKKITRLWIIFLWFSLIMWFSRIMVWVHRPTDIIAWFSVWIFVPLFLSRDPIYKLLKKILITPLIKLQKNIRKLFWVKYDK